jgi:hypothetical protein
MKPEQISTLTSLLTTLVGTSATMIGLVFLVYTFIMQSRKKTRVDKKEQRNEGFIMFVTLFNLAIPMFLSLLFLSFLTFNLLNVTDDGLLHIGYMSLSYLIFVVLSIITINGMLMLIGNKYKFVTGIGLLIILVSILLTVVNYIFIGIQTISISLAVIFMIFIILITLLQIWTFLRTKHTYNMNEVEE